MLQISIYFAVFGFALLLKYTVLILPLLYCLWKLFANSKWTFSYT